MSERSALERPMPPPKREPSTAPAEMTGREAAAARERMPPLANPFVRFPTA